MQLDLFNGSSRDLDLRSNFQPEVKLTYRGQKVHLSTRLDERNTMVLLEIRYLS